MNYLTTPLPIPIVPSMPKTALREPSDVISQLLQAAKPNLVQPTIVELMDTSYFQSELYLRTLAPPKPDHLLVLERPFEEIEKTQIFDQLSFLKATNSYTTFNINEVYRDTAIANKILISDFNYIPFTPRKVA